MCQLPTEDVRVALKEICSYHTKPLLEIIHVSSEALENLLQANEGLLYHCDI